MQSYPDAAYRLLRKLKKSGNVVLHIALYILFTRCCCKK